MIIMLNSELELQDTSKFRELNLTGLANKDGTYKKTHIYNQITPKINTKLKNYGLVGLLSDAYSDHKSVTINPHDIWILIVSELAAHVNNFSNRYREMFTDSDEKKEICVPTQSLTELPIESVIAELEQLVNFDSKILFPNFSTNTPIINEMYGAMFLDMSSSFYNYTMFLCGIRSIKLGGDKNDWQSLYDHFTALANTFMSFDYEDLRLYFTDVEKLIAAMSNTFNHADKNVKFWENIFTQKNVGSGGQLDINGWITDLFIKKHKANQIQNFSINVARVEYKNKSTNQEFLSVHGGFHYDTDQDGYNSLQYTKHIFQYGENVSNINIFKGERTWV